MNIKDGYDFELAQNLKEVPHLDAAFELAQNLKDIPYIEAVILFGSAVKNELHKKRDRKSVV